jgi:hypothetical protein
MNRVVDRLAARIISVPLVTCPKGDSGYGVHSAATSSNRSSTWNEKVLTRRCSNAVRASKDDVIPVSERSIEAQDQVGAQYGAHLFPYVILVFVSGPSLSSPITFQHRLLGRSHSHNPARYCDCSFDPNLLASPARAGNLSVHSVIRSRE